VFDLAVIVLRWVQMTGAMILFGSSLFFLYALPKSGAGSAAALRWPRPLLLASAVAVLAGCLLGLLAQTVVLAGSIEDALQPDALTAAATGMSIGHSRIVRAATAGLFLIAFVSSRPGLTAWRLTALAGFVLCASFAWMGHGAATPGPAGLLHAASDILHTLAAGIWIGALVVFLILLLTDARQPVEATHSLHAALQSFSGIGSALVAVLVATGLINSWFLTGLAGLPSLWTTPYGQLLTLKVALFVGMLGLAASNRFHLTPRLGQALVERAPTPLAIAALRRSLVWETGLSLAVVALVAWFGTLAPPSGG
jgi:putative copper resistance protein D